MMGNFSGFEMIDMVKRSGILSYISSGFQAGQTSKLNGTYLYVCIWISETCLAW